jgi:hypothetical protein
MSQVLVSIEAPRLILGVETSFDSLLGHPSYSLYGKRFEVLMGPCTDSDLLYNVITNAGLFNASADVLVTLHELDGHPRLMAVSSAPCTRVQDHPICCLLTLHDPDALISACCMWRTSCAAIAAQANWHCPESQLGVLSSEEACADVSLVPPPIYSMRRYRTEYSYIDPRSEEITPVDEEITPVGERFSAIDLHRIRQQQVTLDDAQFLLCSAYERRTVERPSSCVQATTSRSRSEPASLPACFVTVDSISNSPSSLSLSRDPTPSVSTPAAAATCSSARCPPPYQPRPKDFVINAVSSSIYSPPAGKPHQGSPEGLDGPRKGAARQALTEAALLAVGIIMEPECCGDDGFRNGARHWSGFGGASGGWPDWGNSAAHPRASLRDAR